MNKNDADIFLKKQNDKNTMTLLEISIKYNTKYNIIQNTFDN